MVSACLAVTSCSSSEAEDLRTKQRDAIEKYFSGRGIIPREKVDSVIEVNPKFYEAFADRAYRHIVTYYDSGRRDTLPTIYPGSKVEFKFNAFVFSGVEPSVLGDLYYSNCEDMIYIMNNIRDAYKPELAWPTEPFYAQIGTTPMLAGLEECLIGCCEKDSVQIYMTYNLGYGSEIGVVPKKSSLAWYLKILSVSE